MNAVEEIIIGCDVPFDLIKPGEPFRDPGVSDIWIRLDPPPDIKLNAVSLKDGVLSLFQPDEHVIPIEAKVVVVVRKPSLAPFP